MNILTPTSAILLVGGLGTRLAPLTSATPKPMLQVAGIPFTEHQIAKVRAAGITEIVLATSYLSEIFEPYFEEGERFGIHISYAVEKVALGTGGAIAHASGLLRNSGSVIVINGDILSSHNLRAQMALHTSSGADVTLHIKEVEDARAFGVVEMDGDRILTFNEKMEYPPTNLINAGCYIFSRNVIDSISMGPMDKVVSVEREVFPQLLNDGFSLKGYLDSSYWLDIGTPPALLNATADLISGQAQSIAFDELIAGREYRREWDSLIAADASIDPSAHISGGSVISRGASIQSGASVVGSVVGEGAEVGSGASLRSTFVAPNTKIASGMIAENQFFGFSG